MIGSFFCELSSARFGFAIITGGRLELVDRNPELGLGPLGATCRGIAERSVAIAAGNVGHAHVQRRAGGRRDEPADSAALEAAVDAPAVPLIGSQAPSRLPKFRRPRWRRRCRTLR